MKKIVCVILLVVCSISSFAQLKVRQVLPDTTDIVSNTTQIGWPGYYSCLQYNHTQGGYLLVMINEANNRKYCLNLGSTNKLAQESILSLQQIVKAHDLQAYYEVVTDCSAAYQIKDGVAFIEFMTPHSFYVECNFIQQCQKQLSDKGRGIDSLYNSPNTITEYEKNVTYNIKSGSTSYASWRMNGGREPIGILPWIGAYNLTGYVTINITVNADGVVTSCRKGSCSYNCNESIVSEAKMAARKTRFSKGTGEASGSITYNLDHTTNHIF